MSQIEPPATSKAPKSAPTRRTTLDYFKSDSAGERFWRMFSRREKVVENLKTLAWVLPITIIIWIYAEREQIVVPTGPNVQSVPITITTSDDKHDVELLGGADRTVNLKLTGPQQAFEKVRAQLVSNIPRGLKIDLGSNLVIGRNQSVNIVEHIQNLDLFKSNGVTVQEAQPPTLLVNVDRLVHRKLPVQVPTSITNLTTGTHFYPAEVTVSGPESLLPATGETGLKIFANLAGNDLLNSEGSHTIASVGVTLSPSQDRLHVEPVQVRADLVVRASDVQYDIKDLPIYVEIAPATLKTFDLVITSGEAISLTHVSGPMEKINSLKDNSFVPRAVLEVIPEDSSLGQTKKSVSYILPEGVTPSPEAKAYQVEFTLTRKQ